MQWLELVWITGRSPLRDSIICPPPIITLVTPTFRYRESVRILSKDNEERYPVRKKRQILFSCSFGGPPWPMGSTALLGPQGPFRPNWCIGFICARPLGMNCEQNQSAFLEFCGGTSYRPVAPRTTIDTEDSCVGLKSQRSAQTSGTTLLARLNFVYTLLILLPSKHNKSCYSWL